MKTEPTNQAPEVVDEDLARARRKQAAVIARGKAEGKDWRKSVGTMTDDAMAREADALGEAWRRAQTDP